MTRKILLYTSLVFAILLGHGPGVFAACDGADVSGGNYCISGGLSSIAGTLDGATAMIAASAITPYAYYATTLPPAYNGHSYPIGSIPSQPILKGTSVEFLVRSNSFGPKAVLSYTVSDPSLSTISFDPGSGLFRFMSSASVSVPFTVTFTATFAGATESQDVIFDNALAVGLDTTGLTWTTSTNGGYTDWAYQADPNAHDGVDSVGVTTEGSGYPTSNILQTTIPGPVTVTFWTSGFDNRYGGYGVSGSSFGGKQPVSITTDSHGWTQWLVSQSGTGSYDLLFTCRSSYNGFDYPWPDTCAVDQVQVQQLITYPVTATAGAGGGISPTGVSRVPAGEQGAFTILPQDGYAFESITGCGGTRTGLSYTTAPVLAPCDISVTFATKSSGNALDNPSLTWTTGGDAPWFFQTSVTHDGVDALQSGAIGNDQSSWLETTVTGPALVRFWWKVSSEQAHDFLRVTVDGVAPPGGSLSGEFGWSPETIAVAAGSHAVRWIYAKDAADSRVNDAAWLDQVDVLPVGNYATVTASAGTIGGSVSPPIQNIPVGARAQVTITPEDGYGIADVYGCGYGEPLSGTTYTTAPLTGVCAITVTFIPTTATGSMVRNRSGHTATPLPGGKMLLVGGGPADVEVYDTLTNTSTLTGSMIVKPLTLTDTWFTLPGHTGTLLPSGKALIAGGGTRVVELYDPVTGIFTLTGSLNEVRTGHTATLLNNGKVLIAGGGTTGSAELYDPATGLFTPTGSMSGGRSGHHAILLPNGNVLIIGGATFLNVGEYENLIYQAAPGTFITTGAHTYSAASATLLKSNMVLNTGGLYHYCNYLTWGLCEDLFETFTDAFTYDPTQNTATRTAGYLTIARGNHTATALSSGKVLLSGGQTVEYNYDGQHLLHITGLEVYDPATDQFSSTGAMGTPRPGHTATLLPNGKVLLAGGAGNSIEFYDTGDGSTLYPVTVTSSGIGGSITPGTADVPFGEVRQYTVTADSGYTATVTGCGGTLSGNTYTTAPIVDACTITGTFQRFYTVKATAGAGGKISPAIASVLAGDTAKFTVTPDSGYVFTSVTGSCGGAMTDAATYTTGPITASCKITANFAVAAFSTVNVVIAGSGSGSVNSTPNDPVNGIACTPKCSSTQTVGSSFTLNATSGGNSEFGGWGDACSGCGTSLACLVSFDVTKSCSATFTQRLLARIGTTYYESIFAAYAKAVSGALIEAQTTTFIGDLLLNRGIAIKVKGGFDANYGATPTGVTTVQGKVTIVTGSLMVERLVIR